MEIYEIKKLACTFYGIETDDLFRLGPKPSMARTTMCMYLWRNGLSRAQACAIMGDETASFNPKCEDGYAYIDSHYENKRNYVAEARRFLRGKDLGYLDFIVECLMWGEK